MLRLCAQETGSYRGGGERQVASKHRLNLPVLRVLIFFFQAEDGIRDVAVTGVQTCALPISWSLGRTWQAATSYQAPGQECYVSVERMLERVGPQERKIYMDYEEMERRGCLEQIGRASCRERV